MKLPDAKVDFFQERKGTPSRLFLVPYSENLLSSGYHETLISVLNLTRFFNNKVETVNTTFRTYTVYTILIEQKLKSKIHK